MHHDQHQLRSVGSAIAVLYFYVLVLYILIASGLVRWWVTVGFVLAGLLVLRFLYLTIKTRRL